ncbi:MAG: hypothetical protein ABIC04_03395 [Nanoarchaeota archaeon]
MAKQLSAIFVMILIVSMPIAFADFLQVSSVHGATDNIEGFLTDTDDTLVVELYAYVSGDDIIETDQVRYGGSGASPLNPSNAGLKFNTCEPVEGQAYSLCTFTFTPLIYFSNPQSMHFYLYDDSNLKVAQSGYTVFFDELPPIVNSFTAQPAIVSSGDISFKLDVTDAACTSTKCNGKCTGIDRIEISALTYTHTIDVDSTKCNNKSVIKAPLAAIIGAAATVQTVSATATIYDVMGNSITATQDILIDTKDPVITHLNVTQLEQEVHHVGRGGKIVTVGATIADENLVSTSVNADLRELNNKTLDYGNKPAICTLVSDNTYDCKWHNIEIYLDDTITAKIRINASDSAGNNASTVLNWNIEYDPYSPEISSIKTNRQYKGISYMGIGYNKIEVSLTEDGSGFNNNKLYMDLSQVGKGASVQTDGCTGSWTCTFDNIDAGSISEGKKTVKILPASVDDLGNPALGVLEETLIFDKTPPSYLAHSIKNVGANIFSGIIKTGDALNIEINVSEPHEIINAYANLSMIIEDADVVSNDGCVNKSDLWTCRWELSPIDITGHIEDKLLFYFTDAANNTLSKEIEIEVLETNDSTTPNFWKKPTVECSPTRIDREITTLIETRSFCKLTLQQQNAASDQEALEFSLGTCVNNSIMPGGTTFLSKQPVLRNDIQGSDEIFMELTLNKADTSALSYIDIKCPLNIVSRVENTVYDQGETEDVAVKLVFYNNPLGTASTSLKEKVKDVEKMTDGAWDLVGSLREFLGMAEAACKIWGGLQHLAAAWNGLKIIFGTAEEKAKWMGSPASAKLQEARVINCEAAQKTGDLAHKLYKGENGINKFCNFVNCKMAWSKDCNDVKGFEGWGQALGGGCGWFNPETDNYFGIGDWAKNNLGKNPNDYMSVKDSFFLSLATWCIPGLIYNIDKYRQIECNYGTCLLAISETPGINQQNEQHQSIPLTMCEKQKDYMECRFFAGEVFELLSPLKLLNYYTDMIKNGIADPGAALGTAFSMLSQCKPACKENLVWPHQRCYWLKLLSTIGEAVKDIYVAKELSDNDWEVYDNYCERFEEMKTEVGWVSDP